jgi:hypothetical protein
MTPVQQAIRLTDPLGRSCLYLPTTQNAKVVDTDAKVFEDDEEDQTGERMRRSTAGWPKEPIEERSARAATGPASCP